MFKYAIVLSIFCFYNTTIFSMHPAAPTGVPTGATAGAPASAPAPDVVIDLTDELNRFVLADAPTHAPGVLTAQEKDVHDAITEALGTKHDNFALFMRGLNIRCRRNGIDFARVCSFQTPAGRSLIDHAILKGRSVHVLKELRKYGTPVRFVDSKTPTLEIVWNDEKNPDQENIIRWLIESDPQQPVGIILATGYLTLHPDDKLVQCINRLQHTYPSRTLHVFTINLLMRIAQSKIPAFPCQCGRSNCGAERLFTMFIRRQ